MTDSLLMTALIACALGCFAVAGAGLATWLLPLGLPARFAWSPVLGASALTGLAASTTTTLTSRTTALAIFLPLLVASLAATLAGLRLGRIGRDDFAGIGWAGVGCTPAALVGVFPLFVNRSAGPINLSFGDGWFWYVPMARLLQQYPVNAQIPIDEPEPNLWIQKLLPGGMRIGHDATSGAFSTLTNTPVDRAITPFVLALLLLVPLTVFAVMRWAGLRSPVAALGGALSGSTAAIASAFETSGPGLFALAAIPALLCLTLAAIERRSSRLTILAAVPLAGLIGTYPESLPAASLGLVFVGCIYMFSGDGSPHRLLSRAWPLARLASIGLLAMSFTPAAVNRTLDYSRTVRNVTDVFAVPWGVTLTNVWQWLTGVVSIFELRRMAEYSPAIRYVAIFASLVGVMFAVIGLASGGRRLRLLLMSGGTSAAAFAVWLNMTSDCSYCFFRTALLVGPFFGAAAATGIAFAIEKARQQNGWWMSAATAGLTFIILVGRGEVMLANTATHARMITTAEDRRLTGIIRASRGTDVLVEGAESAPNGEGYFWMSEALQLIAKSGARPSYDPALSKWVINGGYPDGRSNSTKYDLVATRYGAMATDRVLIGYAGRLAVLRRPEIDVSITTRSGWSVPDDLPAARAIPWIWDAFDLHVASRSGGAAQVEVEMVGSRARGTRFVASVGGRRIRVKRSTTASRVKYCFVVPPRSGSSVIEVRPIGSTGVTPPGGSSPDRPAPPFPQALGVAALRGSPGESPRCNGST